MDAIENRLAHELELLDSLTARYAGPSPPSQLETEEALQRGFASLMALEAKLQGAQHRAGPVDAERFDDRERLSRWIGALREAIATLRKRTEPVGSSFLSPGFVLPADR